MIPLCSQKAAMRWAVAPFTEATSASAFQRLQLPGRLMREARKVVRTQFSQEEEKRLRELMRTTPKSGDPRTDLLEMRHAYRQWATEQPERYAAMMRYLGPRAAPRSDEGRALARDATCVAQEEFSMVSVMENVGEHHDIVPRSHLAEEACRRFEPSVTDPGHEIVRRVSGSKLVPGMPISSP